MGGGRYTCRVWHTWGVGPLGVGTYTWGGGGGYIHLEHRYTWRVGSGYTWGG